MSVACMVLVLALAPGSKELIYESKEFKGSLVSYSSEIMTVDFSADFNRQGVDLKLNSTEQSLRSNACRFLTDKD